MVLGDGLSHLELRVRLGDDHREDIEHRKQHLRCEAHRLGARGYGRGVAG